MGLAEPMFVISDKNADFLLSHFLVTNFYLCQNKRRMKKKGWWELSTADTATVAIRYTKKCLQPDDGVHAFNPSTQVEP